jgi:tRNA (guanine-N7-)-methyltransferase
MARKLKFDIPGPDWRRSLEEVRERGWEVAFAPELRPPLRLVVEIGFGRGEFLMHLARGHPEWALVGVERSFKRTLKMARRLARTEIRNVRLVEATAEEVLRDALAPASVLAFWINFPDPWPKKRHAGRRLMQEPIVRRLAGCLAPGGVLHVATDHVPYAEQIHEVLSKEERLENANAPRPWLEEVPGRLPTAYELEWRAEGRPLHFFSYRRSADSEPPLEP